MKYRSLFTIILAFFFITQLQAQRATPDKIKAKGGDITIQPITHGSVVLTWKNKTIYVDPYGGAKGFEGLAAPDIILITDIHGDHADIKTLEALDLSKATFVVPQAVADMLPATFKNKKVILDSKAATTVQSIGVYTIPMYNLPETADSRHPKGRGNGYIVNLGGKNIYFSGDTEDIPEMRALKNIEVAFVCMNLPYTMDINQAADAVLAFKPKVIYPYHYRGTGGLADVEGFKKLVNTGNTKIDVRLKNWYPAN